MQLKTKGSSPGLDPVRVLGLSLVLLLGIPGCDLFGGHEDDATGRLGEVLWSYDLGHTDEVHINYTQPAVYGDEVYAAGNRELLALGLKDGALRWKLTLSSNPSCENIAVDEGALYVVVAGTMRAYDKAEGTLLWQTVLDFRTSGREVLAQTKDHVFLGGKGLVARFRKQDGVVDLRYWLTERKPDGVVQASRYPLPSGDGMLYAPTGYFAGVALDGNVLAYDLETAAYRWGYSGVQREVPAPGHPGETWILGIDINDGVLFEDLVIFSAKTSIIALDRHSGALRWERPFDDDAFWQGIALSNGKIYVASTGSFIYAMDAGTGEILWRGEDTDGSIITIVAARHGKVYFSNLGGSIWVLDAETGTTLWHGRPPEYKDDRFSTFVSPVNVQDPCILNVGARRVYCLANPGLSNGQ